MSTKSKEHNSTLDVAKGIAIILVVLGHSFPSNIFNDNTIIDLTAKLIYDFVYSFHMPTFFAISGYLFYGSCYLHRRGTVKKKAMRLLIPYISFSFIYIPLRAFAFSMANSEFGNQHWKIIFGISPNGGVWYLYTLFIFMMVTFYFIKKQQIKYFLFTALILSITFQLGFPFSKIIHDVAPRLLDFFRFYCYFLLGLFVRTNKTLEEGISKKRIIYWGMLLFIILFILIEAFSLSLLTVPIAIIGIFLTIQISIKLKHSTILSRLGVNSMDIYLLHGPIMVLLRTLLIRSGVDKLYIAIGLFIGALLISVVVSKYIIHKFRIIEFLCTGIWRET